MKNLLSYHKAIFHIKLNRLASQYIELAEQICVWRAKYHSDFCGPLCFYWTAIACTALLQGTQKQAKPLQDHLLMFKYGKFANRKQLDITERGWTVSQWTTKRHASFSVLSVTAITVIAVIEL